MHENNKTYGSFLPCPIPRTHNTIPPNLNSGFAIALYETRRTIESLWSTVKGTLDPLLRTDLRGFNYARFPV